MKAINFLSTALLFTLLLGLSSCSKNGSYSPQEVDLTLDYTFIKNGSMTKSSSADVYDNFYEKYIKTKILTPKTYSLTFKNKETKEIVLTIDGNWDKTVGIRLPEGSYVVSGISQPLEKELNYKEYKYPSDTVYLNFNEEINIDKDMTKLVLTAKYDSFLLLFDAKNTEKILMYNDKNLSSDSNIYWIFMRDKKFRTSSSTSHSSEYYYDLDLIRKNGDRASIKIKDIPFEKGKYYYFNDATNSFDIPKMESGN